MKFDVNFTDKAYMVSRVASLCGPGRQNWVLKVLSARVSTIYTNRFDKWD